jgi:glycosyltransferase involved in cell wall biosynthesis
VRIAMVGPFGLSPRMTMRARAFQLARHLVARGHQVTIIMPPWHTPELAGRTWTEDGVELSYVTLQPNVPLLSAPLVGWRLLSRALAFEPDVMHMIKPIGYAGVAAWMLYHRNRLARRRIPFAVDQDDWEGRGGWSERGHRSSAARRLISWQERWSLRHAPAVTVASRGLESLVWALGTKPTSVSHLPNGPREWREGDGTALRERYGLGSAPVVLLYTRFAEYDVVRVACAFRTIREAVPDARLLVVGEALDPRDEEHFYASLEDMGLREAVICAGWVPEDQLSDCFAVADVALYPFDDNLINRTKCPVKLTDLLCAEIPVVAESVGEIREFVRHRETGLLVPTGAADALADAAVELLLRPEFAASLARNAGLEMRTRYSWSTRADQLESVYERLIQT